MGVGSITSMNSMSGMWKTTAGSSDVKSKNIQNQITGKQQQMQKISSEKELSANEKANERKQQQKEIVNLNMELKRHQDEFLRSQKRELMMAELQKDAETEKEEASANINAEETVKKASAEKESKKADADMAADSFQEKLPAAGLTDTSAEQQGTVIFKSDDGIVLLKENLNQTEKDTADTNKKQTEINPLDKEEDTDTGLSQKELYTIVSEDASARQTDRQETVISKIKGGIAVLKGEINQDERRGVNTDKKQEELEKLEKKEENARSLQSSVLNKTDNTMNSSAKAKVSGIQDSTEKDVFLNASKLSEEDWTSPQKFYVSLGH